MGQQGLSIIEKEKIQFEIELEELEEKLLQECGRAKEYINPSGQKLQDLSQ